MAQKWPEMTQSGPNMTQNGPRMTLNDPKWPKNDPHANPQLLSTTHLTFRILANNYFLATPNLPLNPILEKFCAVEDLLKPLKEREEDSCEEWPRRGEVFPAFFLLFPPSPPNPASSDYLPCYLFLPDPHPASPDPPFSKFL